MDVVLRGAQLVDGTGAPARRVDVGIEGGRIAEVGNISGKQQGAQEVDLSGLTLAPGFVDIHTHYDAQVLWDRDVTPSSWYGVTTVVMGNCGFGIAPTRPEHRQSIIRTLENVEGMSPEALNAGIPWTFESFPQYLDAVGAMPKRLNVAAMIGHTPLRFYVMGKEASERAATDVEIERMHDLVAEAMSAGAIGFATSKSPTHLGEGGRPVPSRLASYQEIFRVTQALAEAGKGIIQGLGGPELAEEEWADLSTKHRRPVTWTGLLTGYDPKHGMVKKGAALDLARRASRLSGEAWPQISCRPLMGQLTLADPGTLAFPYATFREVLAVPREQRPALYRDPSWRRRALAELSQGPAEGWWPKTSVQETERHTALLGRSVVELARERGTPVLDVLLELSLQEDLKTRFRIVFANDDEDELGQIMQERNVLMGLSDAGAHVSQLCDACAAPYLLQRWVRERGTLSLEEAVRHLTSLPAKVFRLQGRGLVRKGYFADLVAFDPSTVGAGALERVWDQPSGADRVIVQSHGIEHVWVNGKQVRCGGKDLEAAWHGTLIRECIQ